MAKKIKRQIKRSMPLFVIVSLLASTMAIGLVFNLDVEIYKLANEKLKISFNNPFALADEASTTVTVLNAPPSFSTPAAEAPASTSTSPVNIGTSQVFTAVASDPESNNVWLIVCDAAGVTASTTGGPPICTNTTFCVSATSTLVGNTATCDYSSVANPGATVETVAWYAYLCDTHTTEGTCSDNYSEGAAPGSGDNSSPMHVNHMPHYTFVWTSDDNKDPDDDFTVTASSSDPDILGSADEEYIYVCSSNNWSAGGLCGDTQWCSGTSTGASTITCQFASSSPAIDGTFSYFAFVKDWHDFAATSSQTNNYTINNVAPSVSSVELQSGNNITPRIKFATELLATTTGTITDNNGCADIVSATSSIYWESVAGEENCDPDDNDCYQIGTANCLVDASTCTGPSDADVTYNCSTTIAYHILPTDGAGNPNSGTTWLAGIRGFDEALNGVGTTSTGVEMITTTALGVTEDEVPYGSLRSGTNSGAYNATTTINNYGNSPQDTSFLGKDMIRQQGGGYYIAASEQKYGLSAVDYATLSWNLSSTTPQTRDTIIIRPTSMTTTSDEVYWGINVPSGTISGIYNGTSTFSAILDDDAW